MEGAGADWGVEGDGLGWLGRGGEGWLVHFDGVVWYVTLRTVMEEVRIDYG